MFREWGRTSTGKQMVGKWDKKKATGNTTFGMTHGRKWLYGIINTSFRLEARAFGLDQCHYHYPKHCRRVGAASDERYDNERSLKFAKNCFLHQNALLCVCTISRADRVVAGWNWASSRCVCMAEVRSFETDHQFCP